MGTITSADTCGFRIGEDGSRHDVETDVVLLAKNVVDSTNGLHLSSMGKHLATIDVANGIDVGGRRKEERGRINGDGTIGREGDTCSLKIQSLGTRTTPRCHEDDVGIDVGQVLDSSLHVEGDAAFLHQFTQPLGDVSIEGWQALLQIFNHRNL